MKVKEYIEKHFDGEIREKVIAETVKNGVFDLDAEAREGLHPSNFLGRAFAWADTQEGRIFWKNIAESLQ